VGSNVGQLANEAACRLTLEGYGGGSCLAGLGGGIDKLIGIGMAADERVVIDGCPVACAKTIMEKKMLAIDRYVIITELGITKTAGPAFKESDVQTVIDAVKNPSR
jgi:uncharacterized metal-binding protein